jgi:hypothetical protein
MAAMTWRAVLPGGRRAPLGQLRTKDHDSDECLPGVAAAALSGRRRGLTQKV